ncbi:hypothetical protein RHGRI_013319 [Rhododendron griersonianum]|uniref:Uncharacterized protein n=1 Tax=Rhododendron griersonianum TaxID=479676 RepID=A0AAV6K529_9ERIC|nr:hypothetical protein RHGRI_013319 [Rhododendron griersonianum]
MAENYNNSKKELVTAKKQVEDLQGFLSNVISEKEKLSKEVESLQEKNRVLIELNTASDDKINMLNAEIGNANILFERLNTGSKTLDDILSIQRLGLIKEGLGYVEGVSSSKAGGKMVFVKANNSTLTPPVAEKARSPIKMNNVEYACIKSNFSKAKKPSAPVKNITAKRGEVTKDFDYVGDIKSVEEAKRKKEKKRTVSGRIVHLVNANLCRYVKERQHHKTCLPAWPANAVYLLIPSAAAPSSTICSV